MGKLTDRLTKLEKEIKYLKDKIRDLASKTEGQRKRPESRVPQLDLGKIGAPFPSTATGLGRLFGKMGFIVWNDADGQTPPWGQQPADPEIGFNKHAHGRYSGGALDINSLELVEYETHEENVDNLGYPIILDSSGNPVNKHSQSFWKVQPNIAKESGVPKIGLLDIQFDASSKKWVAGSGSIDVEKTFLIQYAWMKDGNEVEEGTEGATREIKIDENGKEMKSPLLYTAGEDENENMNKSNVVWDKNAECWRFYAVFKPYFDDLQGWI